MPTINLLPWREAHRLRKNKQFLVIAIGVALIGMAIVALIWAVATMQLKGWQSDNQHILDKNQRLEVQIAQIGVLGNTQKDILKQLQAIKDLQFSQQNSVRLWEDVAKAVPESMMLTEFRLVESELSLTGKSNKPSDVSQLIRELDTSPRLGYTRVNVIKQTAVHPKNVNRTSETTDKDANTSSTPERAQGRVDFVVTSTIEPDVLGEP